MAVNRKITVLPFKVDTERADWSKLAQATTTACSQWHCTCWLKEQLVCSVQFKNVSVIGFSDS